MPFFVQETHYGNSFREKAIIVKILKDQETLDKLNEDIHRRYINEAIHIFDNYCNWTRENDDGSDDNSSIYLQEIEKYCELEVLEEFLDEIMDSDSSELEKYNTAICTIIQSFLCTARCTEINLQENNDEVILSQYIAVD